MMDWDNFLCEERFGRPHATRQEGRSPFQQDIDRIVFSASFRRLAHKTQVHPLSDNDHVHTRLTHSIEVSSVGRSLGTMVGKYIVENRLDNKAPECPNRDTFGYLVQAACLAHDIGNPPFGHSGEAAIADWFREHLCSGLDRKLDQAQRNDFANFEGNAQGFRILTQTENNKGAGGLKLTHALLGTFTKYPHSSMLHPVEDEVYIGVRKIGFFDSQRHHFLEVSEKLKMIPRPSTPCSWSRHPLAFLVEAADDICYAIIDIEDGYYLGYLTFAETRDVLAPIADESSVSATMKNEEKVAKWRAIAIGKMVNAVVEAFKTNYLDIMHGTFRDGLIDHTEYNSKIKTAKSLANDKIFLSEKKARLEIAGSEIIRGLLDIFVPTALELEEKGWAAERLSGHSRRCARLIIPDGFEGVTSRYEALLRVTDFVSGMTDRYALDLFRKLKGIAI